VKFSTDDTGHSFFLEEFNIDAKVSPAREEVSVFKTSDPTTTPVLTKELNFTARHAGIMNYLVAKSNYRCHVWCGPLHAFEQGKLVILPNTLLVFSLGTVAGIFVLWVLGIFGVILPRNSAGQKETDLLAGSRFLKKMIQSRWPQLIVTLLAMVMIYIVILTCVFGTRMSGRNLGVLLMWAVWLFLLVALITPLFGRLWCTICPLPFFGDLLQRRSFFGPLHGRTGEYNNKFSGLFLKWPEWLKNDWLRLSILLILATFSTTLVASPRVSGITVLVLLLVPTLMSLIWELRAFCRYVCPISVFVGPYSRMSPLAIRSKSQRTCDRCKTHYCRKGSDEGWACPYGINVGEMKENTDCGLCLECTRSCLYNNVTLYKRPFASESAVRSAGEAWLNMTIFSLAIVYSIVYEGHWPVIRDYVNILDKGNWGLFGIYTVIVWVFSLLVIPGVVYMLSYAGSKQAKSGRTAREIFLSSTGALLPMGLMLWIAFVIPMLFVNITFIIQSVSDPFGWGWDFFGTANIPWHQFMPQFIPWLQAAVVMTGLYFSLRNLKNRVNLPMGIFVLITAVVMVVFFTN